MRRNEERGFGGRTVFSALLLKFSKHLALLACLLILGRLTGRYEAGPAAIFAVVLASVCAHGSALALQPRILPGKSARSLSR